MLLSAIVSIRNTRSERGLASFPREKEVGGGRKEEEEKEEEEKAKEKANMERRICYYLGFVIPIFWIRIGRITTFMQRRVSPPCSCRSNNSAKHKAKC